MMMMKQTKSLYGRRRDVCVFLDLHTHDRHWERRRAIKNDRESNSQSLATFPPRPQQNTNRCMCDEESFLIFFIIIIIIDRVIYV